MSQPTQVHFPTPEQVRIDGERIGKQMAVIVNRARRDALIASEQIGRTLAAFARAHGLDEPEQ